MTQITTEIEDFVKQASVFFFATTDKEGKPHVRPFAFLMVDDGKLYFTTGKGKNVQKQLVDNPYFEFCAFQADKNIWLRVSGKAAFTEEMSIKEKAMAHRPSLASLYKGGAADPLFAVFSIAEGEASFCSFSAEPRTVLI